MKRNTWQFDLSSISFPDTPSATKIDLVKFSRKFNPKYRSSVGTQTIAEGANEYSRVPVERTGADGAYSEASTFLYKIIGATMAACG
jgi:hypothetical protein